MRRSADRRLGRLVVAGLAALMAMHSSLSLGQAILTTTSAGKFGIVLPTPGTGLPTPAMNTVTGMPADANPGGSSTYGSDNALVADYLNSRIFVVKVSTAAVVDTIVTTGTYNGIGTIAVAPAGNYALAMGNASSMVVIAAPFTASSTVTTLALPGSGGTDGFQTEAIVFDSAGRAFVYHRYGIAVIDPPCTGVAFTIPVASPLQTAALAITPDGNTLLATAYGHGYINIYSAPFSSSSTPVALVVSRAQALEGMAITPDGAKALVGDIWGKKLYAVSAPFTASSAYEQIPLASAQATGAVAISPDGQLAILAASDNCSTGPVPMIKAPFTAAGATAYDVTVPGGRGYGTVRFLAAGTAQYAVTYDGNGNTGGTAPTDPGTYANGATVTVLGSGNLVRTGLAFAGRNTAANGRCRPGCAIDLDDDLNQ